MLVQRWIRNIPNRQSLAVASVLSSRHTVLCLQGVTLRDDTAVSDMTVMGQDQRKIRVIMPYDIQSFLEISWFVTPMYFTFFYCEV
jgi:hypothetical protein